MRAKGLSLMSRQGPEPQEALGARVAPEEPSPSLPGQRDAWPPELPECSAKDAGEQQPRSAGRKACKRSCEVDPRNIPRAKARGVPERRLG